MAISPERMTWEQAELLEGAPPPSQRIGLALSGGGIRSATFNLGVLEQLRKLGYLERLTYLSTVSGGGYIGSWLTANAQRNPGWLASDGPGWRESIAHLRRNSNYLSPKLGFMSADTWTMGMAWLRNTLLVQNTVFVLIAALLCVPRLLSYAFGAWPDVGPWRLTVYPLMLLAICGVAGNLLRLRDEKNRFLSAEKWPLGLGMSALAGAVAWWAGSGYERFGLAPHPLLAALAALVLVASGFFLVPVAVKLAGEKELNYGQGWTQRAVVIPLMIVALMVAAVMRRDAAPWPRFESSFETIFRSAWDLWSFPMTFVLGCFWLLAFTSVDLRNAQRKWSPQAWITPFLVGLTASGCLYTMLCAVQLSLNAIATLDGGFYHSFVLGPSIVLYAFSVSAVLMIGLLGKRCREEQREWWSRLGAWLGIYGVAWLVLASAAIYGPWLVLTAGAGAGASLASVKWTAALGWVATTAGGLIAGNSPSTSGRAGDVVKRRSLPLEIITRVAPFIAFAGILILLATAIHVALLGADEFLWADLNPLFAPTAMLFLALLGLLVIFAWRVDLNEFGLNAFYRSRLVRCYLGATRAPDQRNPQNFTGFDPADDLPLTLLKGADYRGPIHIVNTALNLGGSSDLALHTRHCASFTFSAYHCGGQRRDDPKTHEKRVGYLPTDCYPDSGGPTLGQVISISGAAASPNMGSHTSPMVAFLLTVFNVRLGWWFANPSGARPKSTSPLFSIGYLVKELFGSAGENSDFVMLSDGGHFENLGIYELVRRRCAVIVAVDGVADPRVTFGDLGNAIRMCQVDFGARIDIDVRPIHPDPATGLSQSHFAVGSIDYGEGHTGVLIYLKLSTTGDEETSVRQYQSDHRTFPHETTADQFFSEDQFESYRLLGKHVARQTFQHVSLSGDMAHLTFDAVE